MPQEGYRCPECVGCVDRCDDCRARRAAVVRERRAQRRKAKLCVECGEPVHREGRTTYTRCARHMSENSRLSSRGHARLTRAR